MVLSKSWMMLSGLGGPRTVLALTIALFSLIIFPEFVKQKPIVKQKPKARHGTTKSGGLYSSSESRGSVEERGPDFVLKHVSDGTEMLVVFYASWCPHCRTYAPKFIQYSKMSSGYSTVFSAVDCATFESLCDAMKITSYPTVVAYNFVRDGKSVTSSLGSHVDSQRVKTYLKTFGTKTSSSSSSDSRVAEDEQRVSMDSKRKWIEQRVAAKARRASASERLGDALSSLKYLLISETPRLVVGKLKENRDRMEALLLLLRVVSALLPKPSALSEDWPNISSALSWAERNSADTKLNESQWRRGISRALAGDATFKQQKTSLRSGASSKVDSHVSDGSKIVWKVCGVTRNETSHADSGYTCGLWLLMHYLTIAGKELSSSSSSSSSSSGDGSSSRAQVTASSVEAAIHALVAKLFTCSLCRKHFLAAYDSCAHGRCGSEGESESQDVAFDRLQLWLFRLHNAVTARVSNDYLGSFAFSSADSNESQATGHSDESASSPPNSLGNKVLWPGSKLGGDEVDTVLVVGHLRQSYWDEKWLV